jgi:hypothetical protein
MAIHCHLHVYHTNPLMLVTDNQDSMFNSKPVQLTLLTTWNLYWLLQNNFDLNIHFWAAHNLLYKNLTAEKALTAANTCKQLESLIQINVQFSEPGYGSNKSGIQIKKYTLTITI